MTSQVLEQSLLILSEAYGNEVADYVRRVARAEAKSHNLEPEEVLSIAYIVLDRTRDRYDADKGQFKNYAIRALKNELIRSKASGFCLYDDFSYDDSDVSPLSQVSDTDGAFAAFDETTTSIEHTLDRREREQLYLTLSAAVIARLTPLERALVYLAYYSTPTSKPVSLRAIAKDKDLSYYLLSSTLRSALSKIREHFDD